MKWLSVLLVLQMLLAHGFIAGCGGGSDVSSASIGDGGSIRGRVLANSPGGSVTYTPLSDVYVLAKREGDSLSRSTYTDANGEYHFSGLPLGTWRLGFQSFGYANISSDSSSIMAYSEAGSTFRVSDTYLLATDPSGDGNVVLTLRDQVTGEPISGASVLVGPSSGVTSFNGECRLSVPVRLDPSTGHALAERVVVSASGVDGSSVTPDQITPRAHDTLYQTIFVRSYGTSIAGRIEASSYHSFYAGSAAFNSVTISSPQVPGYYLSPMIDPYSGSFTVEVPVGISYLDLHFSSPYFDSLVVGPVTIFSQGGGVQNLSSPVTLNPKRRDVHGYISSSSGAVGSNGSVVVVELGLSSTPSAGQFWFNSLPVGMPLTFRASASLPYPPYTETGEIIRSISSDGVSPFELGTIFTY